MFYSNGEIEIIMIYHNIFWHLLSLQCGNSKLLTYFMYLLLFVILSMTTSFRAPKHVWTKKKDGTVVECLVELVFVDGWKLDNGTFRPGCLV